MGHPLLERQLKKAGLEADTLPTDLVSWTALLERISRAYAQSDQDHYLLERSLSLVSEEMQQEISERKAAEAVLQHTYQDLERQKRQLERVHELLRSTVGQMTNLIRHGASGDELLVDLQMIQAEFERLDKQAEDQRQANSSVNKPNLS